MGQKAEKETKAKQDKMTEIKKLNTQIMHIKSKNLKTAEALEDCNRYALFLESITPKEYREEQLRLKAERRSERQRARSQKRSDWWHQKCATERAEMKAKVEAELASSNTGQRRRQRKTSNVETEEVKNPPTPGTPEEEKGNSSSGEDIPMYFKEPSQLIDIFASLGESNLFLIQNCNQTQEALEELKQKFDIETEKTRKETADLDRQMEELQLAIELEEEKKALLEDRDNKCLDGKKEKDKKKKDKDKKKDQEDDADKNERQAQHMDILNRKVRLPTGRITQLIGRCVGDGGL